MSLKSVPKQSVSLKSNKNCQAEDPNTLNSIKATSTNEASSSPSKWSYNGYGAECPNPARGGKFTPEETKIVCAAIHDYCEKASVTVERLCSECDHKAELKGAWIEISKKIPHRTVQSVYRHGLRQLHPFKRGQWSDEECAKLASGGK